MEIVENSSIFNVLCEAMKIGHVVEIQTIYGEKRKLLPVLLTPKGEQTCIFFQRNNANWPNKFYPPITLKVSEIAKLWKTDIGSGFTRTEYDSVINKLDKFSIHHCWLFPDWKPELETDKFRVRL